MSGLYSEWNADLGFGGAEEAEFPSIACDSFFPFPAFPGKRTFPIRQLDLPARLSSDGLSPYSRTTPLLHELSSPIVLFSPV